MNRAERKKDSLKIFFQLKENPTVKQMKLFKQHRNTDSYTHCCHVTLKSIQIARWLKIDVNMKELIYGAMLHDFYLYDIGTAQISAWQHGRRHPEIALDNAKRIWNLTARERNIIYSHMWPLTITNIPRCKEAVVVCAADKLCALEEVFLWGKYRKNHKRRMR